MPPAARPERDAPAAIPVIHAVTDDLILERGGFVHRAHAVMRVLGARGAVHVRAHAATASRLYEVALALRPVAERTGCWLVVNDRLDVALAAGARAVQLTSRSVSVASARDVVRVLAPAATRAGASSAARFTLSIGASVHSVDDALRAAREGADWCVAGHVFPTRSHPGEPARGVALIRGIAAATSLPCLAIGGVRPDRLAALRAAGAYGAAVISGIWGADDAEQAATHYLSAYDARYENPDAPGRAGPGVAD